MSSRAAHEVIAFMATIADAGGLPNLAQGLRDEALRVKGIEWELNTFKQRYQWRRAKRDSYPSRKARIESSGAAPT